MFYLREGTDLIMWGIAVSLFVTTHLFGGKEGEDQ